MRAALALTIALSPCCLVLTGCGGDLTNLFNLNGTPSITSVTPASAVRGSTLTIAGSNLAGTSTTAFFSISNNGVVGQPIGTSVASSGNTVVVGVVVPTTIPAGTYTVYVETSSNGNTSSASNSVSVTLS